MSAHANTRMCQQLQFTQRAKLSSSNHGVPCHLPARLRRDVRSKGGRWSVPFSSRTLASTAVKPDRDHQDKEKRPSANSFRVASENSSKSPSSTSKPQTTASQQKSKIYSASSNASLPQSQNKPPTNSRSVECHSSVEAASLEEAKTESESSSSGLLIAGGTLAGGLGLLLWAGVSICRAALSWHLPTRSPHTFWMVLHF